MNLISSVWDRLGENCIMGSGRDVSQGAVRAKELTIQQVDVREMISSNRNS